MGDVKDINSKKYIADVDGKKQIIEEKDEYDIIECIIKHIIKHTDILKKIDIKNITYIDSSIPDQEPEIETGNREYKRHLSNSDQKQNPKKPISMRSSINRFHNKRASQMLYRLYEGSGKALYILGIEDNGKCSGISVNELIDSINNLISITNIISCKINSIKIYKSDLADSNSVSSDKTNTLPNNNNFILTIRLQSDLI